MQMTGLEDHDIVFVRYVGAALDRNCLPYFIAVDRSTESIGKLHLCLDFLLDLT